LATPQRAAWQRSFIAFAGAGIRHPSELMRVSDDEAASLLARLAGLAWQAPLTNLGRYTICQATTGYSSALFRDGRIVGFYHGSYLWIGARQRGAGLSIPLILAAAEQRGGGCLPPGVVQQGYSRAGLAAHRAAHRSAIRMALAQGRAVPPAVLAELSARPLGRSSPFLPRPPQELSVCKKSSTAF